MDAQVLPPSPQSSANWSVGAASSKSNRLWIGVLAVALVCTVALVAQQHIALADKSSKLAASKASLSGTQAQLGRAQVDLGAAKADAQAAQSAAATAQGQLDRVGAFA